jgi:alkylation response protein AidB-like acyl-CoA dehydrogenase
MTGTELPIRFDDDRSAAALVTAATLDQLHEHSADLEVGDAWPGGQLNVLSESGILGWIIPQIFGGTEISPIELTQGYEALSAACLTTTFVLTQRNGACQRIALTDNEELKELLLPKLCSGDIFATVGISHFTTSRQHLATPAVEARQTDAGFVLNGVVPWVTGARYADYIVTGGTFADGRQMLAAVPTSIAGVVPQEPPSMLALNSSHTGPVTLTDVELDPRWLLAGPVETVMKCFASKASGGAGSVTTSALALGAAAGTLQRMSREVERRPDLEQIYASLATERDEISGRMYRFLEGNSVVADGPTHPETIRQKANSLVLRSAQAYLAASKGAGFVSGHPAERAVREAMFFLVWSCPQPVLAAALREFACTLES